MASPLNLRLAIAQLNPTLGALDANIDKIIEAWDQADDNADIIIYPEMITCGYPPEDLVLKDTFIKNIETRVQKLVAYSKTKNAAILITTPWHVNGQPYNAALLIHNGEILSQTLKHHLPNYGVFDEMRVFKSGPLPEPTEFKGIKLGIMICEDMWFADVAKNLKDKGAEILLVPNGSPFSHHKQAHRKLHARNRATETGLPLLFVNQIGGQDELVFDGASFAVNANGEVIHQSVAFEETLDVIAPDLWSSAGEKLSHLKAEDLPSSDMETIYGAVMLGLRDYIRKNNFPGVLIGLSGGIDSALSAIIAADALGPKNVRCVMMPSRYTSDESLKDAEELAESLNISLESISIKDAYDAFSNTLSPYFDDNTPSVTFENIQPRARGIILMALSNATGSMVLSTGNKSEMAVGYATLYGDMCGGFNALKDLYKTEVYDLSRWRNKHKPSGSLAPDGGYIPENIISKAPTAELKDNQTDQDTLPPYDVLDDILECLIENDMGVEEITARGHNKETVLKVWKMLDRAEYKRRQAPPGVKITSRAFGRDRRYPITNHFLNNIEKP